jgi:hypothetical protein
MMVCDCQEWAQNIDALNSGFNLELAHGGKGYAGMPIKYCPWCGKKLHQESQWLECFVSPDGKVMTACSTKGVWFVSYDNGLHWKEANRPSMEGRYGHL